MDSPAVGTILFLCVLAGAYAQTLFNVDQDIESFHVISDIRYRFATTQMISVVRNTGPESREISFDVTLPKEAFIMHFAMAIDGKVYEGEVKEKKAAKRQYQEAVDRGQSAGHVAQETRNANLFDVSVNVASGSVVNFTLTYQELLHRKLGLYQHEIHVRPGQPVEDFKVKVFIKDKTPITRILTPSVKTDYLISNDAGEERPEYVTVLQRSPNTAFVEYLPSLADQGEEGLNARFLLQYDVEHSKEGDIMMVDGYFVHFYAPEFPPMPKDIIFVLDKSGSMNNRKMDQLKQAMKPILKDLSPEDRFNIINFSDGVFEWKRKLLLADNDIKAEAARFVDTIGANGGTNINDALLRAVHALQHKEESRDRAPLVFFLTDGQATSGVTDSTDIKSNIRNKNEGVVSIFSLAFGHDADYELLKAISGQNSGFARKIYEASDSALQVATLYQEISAVVAKDLKVQYLNGSVDEFSLTQNEFSVVFNGSEVIICGRMGNFSLGGLEMEVSAVKKGGDLKFSSWVNDILLVDPEEERPALFTGPRDYAGIVERMWAFLTIKQMLKEKESVTDGDKADELKEKIIEMAVKYKFVTPLTSMVVTKPEQEGKSQETSESGLTDVDDVQSGQGIPPYLASMRTRTQGTIKRRYGLPSQSHLFTPSGAPQNGQRTHYQYLLRTRSPGIIPSVLSDDEDDFSIGLHFTVTNRPLRRTTSRPPRPTRLLPIGNRKRNRRKYKKVKGGKGGRGGNGRKGKGGRRGKGGKGRGRANSKDIKVLLSVLSMNAGAESYCILPKKWTPGNYSLLVKPSKGQSNSSFPILLELGAGKKRTLAFQAVYFPDGTMLSAANLTTKGWQYKQGSDFDIGTRNDFSATAMGRKSGTLFAAQVIKKTRRAWYLDILIGGLGDIDFLKTVRAKSNKRNRTWCGLTGNSYSVIGQVAAKKARRYFVKGN